MSTHELIRPDGALPVTLYEPPPGEARVPALLVIPSIFGVGDDLEEQMQSLAKGGALVAAIDPFWRISPGPLPYSEADHAIERMQQLDKVAAYDDVRAAANWLRTHVRCNAYVAGLGICFGGPFVLLGAADDVFQGVATWHGSRMDKYLDRAAEMQVPMTHHIGGADEHVSDEAIQALQDAFGERPDVEIVVHPGARHGFSQTSGPAYDRQAEPAARQATAALLDQLRTR